MAIQKSVTDITGTVHTSAYVLVQGVWIGKQLTNASDEAWVDINLFHDAAARSKADPIQIKKPLPMSHQGTVYNTDIRLRVPTPDVATYFADSVLDDTGKSPIKQAYAWLKAQDDQVGIDWTTGTTDV